jgi:hypothetical protein
VEERANSIPAKNHRRGVPNLGPNMFIPALDLERDHYLNILVLNKLSKFHKTGQ